MDSRLARRLLRDSIPYFLPCYGSPDALQRVVIAVNHALLELDNRIVCDLYAGGADLGAATRDVAVFHAELVFDFRDAIFDIERVHLVLSEPDEVSRSGKVIEKGVVPQHVAGVDAEETLDALSEVLDTVSFHLVEFPVHGLRPVDGRNALGHFVVPGDIGDEVFDVRERLHRPYFYGLSSRCLCHDIAHSGHAHEARPPVDFCRA